MALLTTILAVLLLADALFTWANLDMVESILIRFFPKLNIKLVALIEGSIGLATLIYKVQNGTIA